ncbi:MAG: sugar phosphate isomerase/epimerase [Saprospiraceae bacterium]|nr:sugar phosphate isomerase/epimerase [Saprospiraceae bacterium]
MNRQEFLRSLGVVTLGASFSSSFLAACSQNTTAVSATKSGDMFFKISLAQWSLHKALFAKEFDNLDFPVKAQKDFGISAVEYVNQFFKDKAKDEKYLAQLKQRCNDHGVTSVLIMIDGEGEMADVDAKKRMKAVENHYQWVDAAKFLGCHSIRVNCFGVGNAAEVAKAGADGLRKLSEYAQKSDINVIVENHGGYSSDGQWLSGVMKAVGMPNCGTLPDFGNFCIRREKGDMWESPCVEEYDRYKGVKEMMPFAKGVSAKSHDFDDKGNCIQTDYVKMLKIVKDAGYKGYVGIEYEGSILSEPDGIRATKALLERVGKELG